MTMNVDKIGRWTGLENHFYSVQESPRITFYCSSVSKKQKNPTGRQIRNSCPRVLFCRVAGKDLRSTCSYGNLPHGCVWWWLQSRKVGVEKSWGLRFVDTSTVWDASWQTHDRRRRWSTRAISSSVERRGGMTKDILVSSHRTSPTLYRVPSKDPVNRPQKNWNQIILPVDAFAIPRVSIAASPLYTIQTTTQRLKQTSCRKF